MRHLKQIIITLTALLSITTALQAQDDYERETKANQWYADKCEAAIMHFENSFAGTTIHPQKYCLLPQQQASPLGYALLLSTMDEKSMVMLTPSGNNLKAQVVGKNVLSEEIYWRDLNDLGRSKTPANDITLRERPLPVREASKNANIFKTVVEGPERIADIKAYNQMIFKPHKNSVRLTSQNPDKKVDENGTVLKDNMNYTFKLNTPSIVAKMFRGYNDVEICPWVVKNSFFDHHILLQYSRWKDGEPIKKAGEYACRLISDYYGGRRIKESRWLASVETAERSFYAVQFEHQGKDALAALVCIAEGEVVSTWEFHGTAGDEDQSIWFVDDEGNFMEHAPEIHCIVATDEGLELYIRLFGGESVQYYILREMSSVWMTILTDYWIYVWD
ncbi:MAG: hypothetical protein J5529_06430 [Prevotella sp.]|nr:hypothetical protein [Prevotella sp.]